MDVSDGAAAATPPGVRHAHTLTPVTSIGTASGEGASTESHAAAASLPKMKVPVLGAKKGVDFAANESANQVTLPFADVKTEVMLPCQRLLTDAWAAGSAEELTRALSRLMFPRKFDGVENEFVSCLWGVAAPRSLVCR